MKKEKKKKKLENIEQKTNRAYENQLPTIKMEEPTEKNFQQILRAFQAKKSNIISCFYNMHNKSLQFEFG